MKAPSFPLNRSDFSDSQRPQRLGCYTLTDLQSLAIQSLEANPIFRGRMALGAIQVESDGDTLVLNGHVPSYYLKQLLQEALRRVDGVTHVENHVVVVNPGGLLADH